MLTLAAGSSAVRDDRPAYRPFRAHVARLERLAPHFRLVTFRGEELDRFGTDGLDQRVKIIFPFDDGRLCDPGIDDPRVRAEGAWYRLWRDLPDADRNPFRTFTVRAVRPWAREVDFVFVDHNAGDGATNPAAGPAARWVASARPGDRVVIVGPDARSRHSSVGIDFHPGDATRVLLAGDETAAPAICTILEALPPWRRATAFVEVPGTLDTLPLAAGPNVELTWLPRRAERIGEPLQRAVCGWLEAHSHLVRRAAAGRPQHLPDVDVDRETLWESPERAWGEGLYAWLAGESAVVKAMRRHLVTECGIDRRRVAFMGYWRLGQAERQW